MLVAVSTIAGYLFGDLLAGSLPEGLRPMLGRYCQVLGVAIILWATIFVRGWEIQTYGGKTPADIANRCIYRALYVIGTVLLVASMPMI